jgi:TolB protein
LRSLQSAFLAIALSGAATYGQSVTKQNAPAASSAIAFASFSPLNSDIFIADGDGRNPKPLVAHPALDYNASFSPDGRWIVFTSERNGSADIYRVRADGSGLERLTAHPAFDDQAAVSPDGRWLAFVSSRTGQADIWVLDLKSRALRNLTNDPGGDFRPAWSPDGQWIAFSSDRDSKRPKASFATVHSTEIYIVRRDGTGFRRLTTRGAFEGSPSWSPDGKRLLVYEADVDQVASIVAARRLRGTTQIATIDVTTGERRVLTTGAGEKWSPRWLPDHHVAYVSGGESGGLEFVSASPGPRGEFGSPSWSPDGRKMVFHRDRGRGWPPLEPWHSRDPRYRLVRTGVFASYSPAGDQLVVNDGTAGISHNSVLKMNADGSHRVVLVSDSVQSALAPAWSPQGDRIAFAMGRFFPAVLGRSWAAIAVVRTDGTGLTLLTDSTENAGFPSWSPDGRQLVYRVALDGRSALMIVDVKTHSIRRLTDGTANDNSPAWSPRGDRIAFTSKRDGESDYDIYSIRPDGTDLHRLTNAPGNDSHPAWSPDDEWIAFTSARGGFKDEAPLHPFNPQPYGEICVMRADGSDFRVLTDNQFEDGTPTWIPTRHTPTSRDARTTISRGPGRREARRLR